MAKTLDNTPIDDLVAFIEDKSKTCKKRNKKKLKMKIQFLKKKKKE